MRFQPQMNKGEDYNLGAFLKQKRRTKQLKIRKYTSKSAFLIKNNVLIILIPFKFDNKSVLLHLQILKP